MRVVLPAVLVGAALVAASLGCSMKRAPTMPVAPFPRQELIAEIKDFQKTLGFEDQENFSSYSETQKALYRCYYTGKLELPESYEKLRLTDGSVGGCSLDEERYDVFFYEMEAAASGRASVTAALTEAPLERLLVVVPHEDFHNQTETEKAAPEIAEAASTLIGFLTASRFANGKYGADSGTFQSLDREARLFLEKARIVNAYFDRLSGVYGALRSKRISRDDALARKEELFSEVQQECAAITPGPASFNPCLGAMNNAGLAFERTYSRYYPLLYEVSAAHGHDAAATVAALKRVLATRPRSERDLVRALAALPD